MKVLSVITTGFTTYGGLATVAINYYRHMNHHEYHIDFSSNNEIQTILREELCVNRDRYFRLPRRVKVLQYYKLLKKLCATYDVVHIHGNSATTVLELMAAKQAGVSRRIVHIHTTQSRHRMLHYISKPLFDRCYTKAIAVSRPAGEWIFPKGKFTVLKNAIETEKYRFSIKNRTEIRDRMRIQTENVLIGHVGKLYYPKNHAFLLRCFSMLYKRDARYRLLLVGDGSLKKEVIQQIEDLGIRNAVFMPGMVSDPWRYLSAMDIFVFPSLYEGLPLALCEATANGLTCIVSDRVTFEVNIAGNIRFLPIKQTEAEWADCIQSISQTDRETSSEVYINALKVAGYDVALNAKELELIYRE